MWWMGSRPIHLVCYSQSLLGLMVAVLLYFSLRALEVSRNIALAGSVAFALVGGICLFELLLLSEILSLFFLATGIYFFARCMNAAGRQQRYIYLGLAGGLSFCLAILTRPENLVFFAVLIITVLALSLRCLSVPTMRSMSPALAGVAVLLVIAMLPLLLCWMTWNLLSTGQFRINTLNGLVMSETTYNMFNRVDPEDHVLGSILSQSYALTNDGTHVYRHHVWRAMDHFNLIGVWAGGLLPVDFEQMKRDAGLASRVPMADRWAQEHLRITHTMDPVSLFDYIGKVSWKLARKYPEMYLHNVSTNFFEDTFNFDYVPPSPSETADPHAPDGGTVVRSKALWRLTTWIGHLESPLLTSSYVVLLGFVLFGPVLLLARYEGPQLLRDATVVALAMGTLGTFICSCFVAAYYPQHGVPFLTVLFITMFYALDNRARAISLFARKELRSPEVADEVPEPSPKLRLEHNCFAPIRALLVPFPPASIEVGKPAPTVGRRKGSYVDVESGRLVDE